MRRELKSTAEQPGQTIDDLLVQLRRPRSQDSSGCVAAALIEKMRAALLTVIHEATHLSPAREDGSHDCRISGATLQRAREAVSDNLSTRRIAGVAMMMPEATAEVIAMPAPARHHDLIRKAREMGRGVEAIAAAMQGFYTDEGNFVPRSSARRIALCSGQAKEPTIHQTELFSEDVW